MELIELRAKKRDAEKNSASRTRLEGKIPAVLYGQGLESMPISVEGRDFLALTHKGSGSHPIVKLKIDGTRKQETAIVKEVQRHPLKDTFLHIDFLKIDMTEKIKAGVPVTLTGEAPGVKEGGILQHNLWEVEVEALPKDLPDQLVVDISELNIGDTLHVSDLDVPENVTVLTDPSQVTVSITTPSIEEVEEVVEEELEEEVPVIGEKPAEEAGEEAAEAETE